MTFPNKTCFGFLGLVKFYIITIYKFFNCVKPEKKLIDVFFTTNDYFMRSVVNNLIKDSNEMNNLAKDSNFAEILSEMKAELNKYTTGLPGKFNI